MSHSKLYLVPTLLHAEANLLTLPQETVDILRGIKHWVVETEKNARAFLKKAGVLTPQSELVLHLLNEHTKPTEIGTYLDAALQGHPIGLMSDAGLPAIADPGALVVEMAHRIGIEVVPLTGPSSIFLALMASGLNGQQFTFHGYLPIDKILRSKKIKALEQQQGHTHIFIETPYRNQAMFDELLRTCQPATKLCIGYGLHSSGQWIMTKNISQWKHEVLKLEKNPAVFLLLSSR
ncbi:MAG: SAM-dependent methyltransferase [Flavobacteriaceae bacterium]|nr:SAM-dependent methyltransferase [Flavobacteriaceae bacterium]